MSPTPLIAVPAAVSAARTTDTPALTIPLVSSLVSVATTTGMRTPARPTTITVVWSWTTPMLGLPGSIPGEGLQESLGDHRATGVLLTQWSVWREPTVRAVAGGGDSPSRALARCLGRGHPIL